MELGYNDTWVGAHVYVTPTCGVIDLLLDLHVRHNELSQRSAGTYFTHRVNTNSTCFYSITIKKESFSLVNLS